MAIALQQPVSNELAQYSTAELETDLLSTTLPATLRRQIEGELAQRKVSKAFITVTLLKNTRVKPVSKDPSQANLVRIQGTLENAEITNWNPETTELTYNFKTVADTAKIPVFLVITRDELARIPLATSNQVRMEVSFTKAPNGKTQYVLVPTKIDMLETRNIPGIGNQTKKVFVSTDESKAKFWGDAAPDETYSTVKVYAYGNVNVQSVLDVQMVNLAVLNSEIIEDPMAWIKQAESDQRKLTDINLQAYNAKRDIERQAAMAPTTPNTGEELLTGAQAAPETQESLLAAFSSEGT